MNRRLAFLSFVLSLSLGVLQVPSAAQTPIATASALPRLVRFGGTAKDINGNPLTGVIGITFALHSEQTSGAALWLETQNVTTDSNGHYMVLLGSTKPDGLPAELFTSEQARWVGVQISGQAEQPRVLLVSAPYALKAGDAETIGGLPPSAFMLAAPGASNAATAPTTFIASTASSGDVPAAGDVTGSGTADFIPLWTTTSNIANSVLFQSGTGASARIGVNNTAPATTLDVKGAGTIRGMLNLPATGVATAAAGKNSQPLSLVASAFNTSAAVNQTFRWQAEPAGNDTATPSGTLNLLFAEGTSAPSETGLHVASNGQITFAAGQTFPGTGNGTVTSVAAGVGLKGGTITESGTLSVDPTMVAFLGGENQFTASQNVVGTLTATNLGASGTVTGGTVTGVTVNGGVVNATTSFSLGGLTFDSGSAGFQSAFLGFAGNSANAAFGNTAAGWQALASNTASPVNTAFGSGALQATNGGDAHGGNTGVGNLALSANTTGTANTAVGSGAGATVDQSPITGNFNAAIGAFTAFSTGTLTNATAIGTSAEVSESNALVLGGISGVNGGTSVNVGIGTTTPAFSLDVHGTGNFTGAVNFGTPVAFAAGQTFPGTGTITGVTAGTGLTGGGSTGSVTLGLASNACAAGNALSALPFTCSAFATLGTNTFTGNQTVNGNLSATSFSLGGTSFAFGSFGLQSAFLGFAGNTANTAFGNTAAGWEALASDTASTGNTAVGAAALKSTNGTTADGNNTAVGIDALRTNTTGAANTAIGASSGATADNSPVTGNSNAAIGAFTAFSTGTLTNATAIGTSAEVSESNALVLGGINGVNNGTSVSVGIGTSAPGATLDVRDNGSGGNTISATTSALNNAVYGNNTATSGSGANGGFFTTSSPEGTGVVGVNTGTGGNDYAGFFQGNVFITGSLSKGSGSFQIDHPLDPANKFLYHSFVESPDMMNIYNGVATLDARGSVWITLPDYFEALNQDFRYQLTSMGRPQPSLYVAREISGNRFRISGGKPGGKVSWQVTGIRHDVYADAHRIQVEVEKPPQEQGRYLHPELFGAPAEQAIGYPAQAALAHTESARVLSPKAPPAQPQ